MNLIEHLADKSGRPGERFPLTRSTRRAFFWWAWAGISVLACLAALLREIGSPLYPVCLVLILVYGLGGLVALPILSKRDYPPEVKK